MIGRNVYRFISLGSRNVRLFTSHRHVLDVRLGSRRWLNTKFYNQMSLKGLICTTFPDNADMNQLLSRKQTIYAGFDPTSDSLHVGNMLILISLFHLLQQGHRVIVLIGDATARIGDPSGKLTERPVLSSEVVDKNAHSIEQDVLRVYHNFKRNFAKQSKIDDDNFIICQNSSWYSGMNVIDFVDKYARHLRMGDMLNKSAIRERLDSDTGLSFAEFSYQTFQAYDWLHLFRKYGCRFQLGGIDQTVNLHNGYTLIKKLEGQLTYGLFVPLITDEKGNKIGKSEGKPVFLDPDKTTPFGLYQYFMRIRDTEVARFLRLYSFRPLGDIESMIQHHLKTPKPWYLQGKLAEEMTLLAHGESGLESAKRVTQAFFERDLDLLGSLSQQELQEIFAGVNEYYVEFVPGHVTVLDLALKSGCFDSNMNAIHTIQDGGFYINYVRISNPSKVLTEEYILKNNITIVSVGKRNHRLIRWL